MPEVSPMNSQIMGMHIMSKLLAFAVIAAVATALPSAAQATEYHYDLGPKVKWETRTTSVSTEECENGPLSGSSFLGIGSTSMVGFSKRTCETIVTPASEQYCVARKLTGWEEVPYQVERIKWEKDDPKDYSPDAQFHPVIWYQTKYREQPVFDWVEVPDRKCEPRQDSRGHRNDA